MRRPELTSLRGLAALWVFIYHIPIYVGFPFPANFPLVSAGYLGVPIFFILSISLLLGSLDNNASLKHYFTRRIKRTWPMYFMSVMIVGLYYSRSLAWLLEQTTFSGAFYDAPGIHYIFWSLQVEELAYLFFPLIHRLSSSGKLATGISLYGLGILAFYLVFKTGSLAYFWWLPIALSSYGIGIIVYLKKIPSMCVLLIAPALFFWNNTLVESASFLVAPGFGYLIQQSGGIKILKSKSLVWVGDVSYGLYLVHAILLSAFGFFGIALALPAAWAFEKANKELIHGMARLKAVRPLLTRTWTYRSTTGKS